jgi:hypothetical protein
LLLLLTIHVGVAVRRQMMGETTTTATTTGKQLNILGLFKHSSISVG